MKQLLQQITAIWSGGTGTQRALSVLSVLVIGGGILASVWLSSRPDHELLFGNLDPADAALVVEEVRGAGVVAELRDGGRSVYVPRSQVAEMRVRASSVGLPRGTGSGWELFDKSSFGVSDFEQSVMYRRALEGELARSIAAFDVVEAARVSITKPKRSPFAQDKTEAKASVMVKTRAGMDLSRDNVASIKHLIAGAVEGLVADQVSVMDTRGRVLSEPGDDSYAQRASSQVELRREMERYLESKAQAMLDRVGLGAVVRIALEMDFQQIKQTSETFSPDGRVAQETIQNSKSRPAGGGEGPAGTEAKVGDGLALPAAAGLAQSEDQETIETTYRLDRTVKSEEVNTPVIRRMTVGMFLSEQHAGSLDKIQELVKTAVGFDAQRGDRMESMTHEFLTEVVTDVAEDLPEPALWLTLVERAIPVIGVVCALFLLLRLLKMAESAPRTTGRAIPSRAPSAGRAGAAGGVVAPGGAAAGGARRGTHERAPAVVEERVNAAARGASAVDVDPAALARSADAASLHDKIKNTIQSDPAAATRVLQSWLRDGNLN